MTTANPEASALLRELGNEAESIPFVALFSWTDPDNPITLRDVFTTGMLLNALEQIPPSRADTTASATGASTAASGEGAQAGTVATTSQGGHAGQDASSQSEEAQSREELWKPFSIEELEALRSRGVPLVVDWTADW